MRTRLSGQGSHRGRHTGIAVAIVAVLFVATRILLPDVFLTATAPVFGLGDALSRRAGAFFASFGNARALAERNRVLVEENAVLALQNQALEEKVRDLSALFATTSTPARGIVAGVVMRPPTAPYDILVLASGSTSGVTPLMGAYGAGGVPLGVVRSVTTHYARLELFSSPGALTDAWVGEGRLPTTLRGVGAGAFTAGVSQASGVVEGDLVYLAGPGLVPIARVARITGAPSDPVATLAIQPLVNPFSTLWVELRPTPLSASTTLGAAPGAL